MNAGSNRLLDKIHPRPAFKAQQMSRALLLEGIDMEVYQGLRSWNLQAAYYAQGRETTAQVNSRRLAVGLPEITDAENRIVTKARPGYGWHEFGLAFDAAPFDLQGQPDWNETHPAWQRMLELGKQVGLSEGADFRTFPDCPHFQDSGVFPVTPNDEVRQIFKDGGMAAVWATAIPDEVNPT